VSFFSSRRRHTISKRDWSSDVCSTDLHHTVIAFPNGTVRVNPTGNTALSKGGTGDVLTGMITSMLSYDKNPYSAIVNAVYLHGYCAELWTETNGEATMTASDFHTLLPKAFYHIQEE